jgi:Ca-activated chloride channel homolog
MAHTPATVWLLVASAAIGGGLVAGPDQRADRPAFSSQSELVVVHVMVKSGKGAYVTNLAQDAFAVEEDGQRQNIQFFASEDSPVTVGLLVDSSASMWAVRDRLLAAVAAFAETSNSRDDMFAVTFNESVRAALPATSPFTGDAATLRAALSDVLVTRGRTALYDAIATGLSYVSKGRYEGRVLVLISDGGDNASAATKDESLRLAQSSNTTIYAIVLADPLDRETNPRFLQRLAESSGGEAFTPRSVGQIEDVLRHIALDIRHTYTIGYVPANLTRDGRLRQIRVRVTANDGGRLRVRARQGYVLGGTP